MVNSKQVKNFSDNDRFLRLSIYKFPLGDCGGVTDKAKNIYVPCIEGPTTFADIKHRDEMHLVFIEEKRGEEYHALYPMIQPTDTVGPMAGGNLAYTSDSRCKRVYHVHDRFETQATYDAMSR